MNLETRSAALAYLRSLPPDQIIALPSSGEMTTAEADAVSVLAGEHASSWARARNRWEWTASELLEVFAPKEVR